MNIEDFKLYPACTTEVISSTGAKIIIPERCWHDFAKDIEIGMVKTGPDEYLVAKRQKAIRQ